MKFTRNTRKLFLLLSFFTFCLVFAAHTQAADRDFSKKTVVLKERQTKTITLKNSDTLPKVVYYDEETCPFTYVVKNASEIEVTATRGGMGTLFVENGTINISCNIVVMPEKSSALIRKNTKKGTSIAFRKVRLTLPKAWKTYGYVVLTDLDHISFFSKRSYRAAHGGHIFTIEWCSAKEYQERAQVLPDCTFLKRKGNTVYYMTRPTDVQYNVQNKKERKQYRALDKTIRQIRKSFKIAKKDTMLCELPAVE